MINNEEIIKENSKYIKGKVVLDVDCYDGHITNELSKIAKIAVGTDKNRDYVNDARKRYPDLLFLVSDIRNTVIADNTFDLVFISSLWDYYNNVTPINDIKRVKAELKRITRNEGYILIVGNSEDLFKDEFEIINNGNYTLLRVSK